MEGMNKISKGKLIEFENTLHRCDGIVDEEKITSVKCEPNEEGALADESCQSSPASCSISEGPISPNPDGFEKLTSTNSQPSHPIKEESKGKQLSKTGKRSQVQTKPEKNGSLIKLSSPAQTPISISSKSPLPNSSSRMAPMLMMNNLPYMGELTFDNRPRRGRKPKKADICHLISKNYGIHFPNSYLESVHLLQSQNSHSPVPFSPTSQTTTPPPPPLTLSNSIAGKKGIGKIRSLGKRVQNITNGLSFEWPTSSAQLNHLPPDLVPRLPIPMPQLHPLVFSLQSGYVKRASENNNVNSTTSKGFLPVLIPAAFDEPLNLCMRDTSSTGASATGSKRGGGGGNEKATQNNNNNLNNDNHLFSNFNLKRISKSNSTIRTSGVCGLNNKGSQRVAKLDQNPTQSNSNKRKTLSQSLSDHSSLVNRLSCQNSKATKPSTTTHNTNNNNNNIECDNNIRPTLKRAGLSLTPSSSSTATNQSNQRSGEKECRGGRNKRLTNRGSSREGGAKARSKAPRGSESKEGGLGNYSNAPSPAAEVSICKFKFTGGAKPTLQEKKMLSVDAGGNFRFYSDKGSPSMTSSAKHGHQSCFTNEVASVDYPQLLPKSAKSMSMCMSMSSSLPIIPTNISSISRPLTLSPSQSSPPPQPQSASFRLDQRLQLPPLASSSYSCKQMSSPSDLQTDSGSESFSDNGETETSSVNTERSSGKGAQSAEELHKLNLKRKRRTRKSLMREKLEKTFKEKGFLIQTQQLESAEGATYCKFRQLRKFTRYLFRSWKDYLPENVKKINAAAEGATQDLADNSKCPHPPGGNSSKVNEGDSSLSSFHTTSDGGKSSSTNKTMNEIDGQSPDTLERGEEEEEEEEVEVEVDFNFDEDEDEEGDPMEEDPEDMDIDVDQND